ncbi:hypothetical protein [Streptomyces sp. NPDC001165]|uniref:hypothetical protein n=1 Tax=Streptomyces sp. NPDC001165 TaxID=3364546 RepID=UPI003698B86D
MRELLAEGLVVEWPVSGERIVGPAHYVRMADREYWTELGSDPSPEWRAGLVQPL